MTGRLEDALAAIRARLTALENARVEPARWATVTAASPLRIRLDGDPVALLLTPQALVAGLQVGDRVHVRVRAGDAPLIIGRLGG